MTTEPLKTKILAVSLPLFIEHGYKKSNLQTNRGCRWNQQIAPAVPLPAKEPIDGRSNERQLQPVAQNDSGGRPVHPPHRVFTDVF